MPATLLVKKKLNRQQDIEERTLKVRIVGRKCMAEKPAFCQHPQNSDSCRLSLVEAWQNKAIDKHCIIEGLKTDFAQCRQVLQDGLYSEEGKVAAVKLSSSVNKSELEQACKEVVLFGYPLEIKTIYEVFYNAYYRLIRTVILRFGFSDNTNPSSDDKFQQVFINLHRHFLRGASVREPLRAYVAKVTAYECFRPGRSERKRVNLVNENEIKEVKHSSVAIMPFEAVDLWEYFDSQLLASEQGNLINRIILAQQCIEGCSSGKRPSAKQLRADWRVLSQKPKNDILALHDRVAIEVKQSPSKDTVPLAADLINSGTAEPYQVAIIFAAATGTDKEQTTGLVEQLSNLSENAVYTRICRIYAVFGAKGTKNEKYK